MVERRIGMQLELGHAHPPYRRRARGTYAIGYPTFQERDKDDMKQSVISISSHFTFEYAITDWFTLLARVKLRFYTTVWRLAQRPLSWYSTGPEVASHTPVTHPRQSTCAGIKETEGVTTRRKQLNAKPPGNTPGGYACVHGKSRRQGFHAGVCDFAADKAQRHEQGRRQCAARGHATAAACAAAV